MKHLKFILIAILAITGFFIWSNLSRGESDNEATAILSLDKIIPTSIAFAHTDENEGEDLIITSDKKTYQGFSGTTVYFNINPLMKESENVSMQFYFTDPEAKIVQIYQYQKEGNYWLALPLNNGEIRDDKYSKALLKKKKIEGETQIQSNTSFGSEGETEYFMAELVYTPGTPGQFLIEAFGSSGSYGILDPWYNSGWDYRKKITVNPQYVEDGLANFPMLFSRIDPDLRAIASGGHVASTTGGDILFADDAGTKYDHEIERYTSTTGELIAWVEVPFISSTSTRELYIYYGNSTVPLANQQNSTGVWDSNYKGVWHLSETSGTHFDSTNNDNDSTSVDVQTQGTATGQIGGADDLEDSSTDDIRVAEDASLDIASSWTVSVWVRIEAPIPEALTWKTIFTKGPDGDQNYFTAINGDEMAICCEPTSDETSVGIDLVAGVMYYMTWVFDNPADLNRYFLNGSQRYTSDSGTGNPSVNNEDLTIGARETDTQTWDGIIDEVRLSDTIRSLSWIATEYNNQNSPNSFYSYGGEDVEIRSSAVSSVKVRGKASIRGGVKFR